MAVVRGTDPDTLPPSGEPGPSSLDPPPLPISLPGGTAGERLDSYTEGIELSNACRRFYVSRVQVSDRIKSTLDRELASSGQRSLDQSMGTLRREVVSLIDQDLSLMKQLLTLNERIEDLKWQRKFAIYNPNSSTTCASSGNILSSEGFSSDWEGEGRPASVSGGGDPLRGLELSEKDLVFNKYLSPSKLSVFRDCMYNSDHGSLSDTNTSSSPAGRENAGATTASTTVTTSSDVGAPSSGQHHHSTSDLGSSDELVNSVSDDKSVKSYSRVSQADSSISMDCHSNSSSLKKSDIEESATVLSVKERCLLFGGTHAGSKSDYRFRSRVETGDNTQFDSTQYSYDPSSREEVDHNMEMII